MQLRTENQNLVSALSNYQQILYQFFDFTQNLKQSPQFSFKVVRNLDLDFRQFVYTPLNLNEWHGQMIL